MKSFRIILLFLALICLFTGCGKKKKDTRAHLDVRVKPESAQIWFDGDLVGKSRVFGPVVPGRHTLKFTRDGYHTVWKILDMPASSKNDLGTVTMEPVKTVVMIDSSPKGASVAFNGSIAGTTPCIIRNLVPGDYKASLKMPGFAVREITWKVDSARPKKVEVTLASNRGKILVTTQPEGARVFINGNPVGKSPYEGICESGKYQVAVEKNGYVKFTNEAVVTTGETTKLNIALDPKKCALSIRTLPSGAQIRINGKNYGKAPVSLAGIPAGEYQITASMQNHDDLSKVVNIAPGQSMDVPMDLVQNTGAIEFVTTPAGIRVYLNNKFMFVTEKDPSDPRFSRVHRIDLLKPDRYDLSFRHKRATRQKMDLTVTVEKGKTYRLDKNIEMWIPNARITKQDGSELMVRIVAHSPDGSYTVETVPVGGRGKISYKLKKGTFTKVEMLGEAE